MSAGEYLLGEALWFAIITLLYLYTVRFFHIYVSKITEYIMVVRIRFRF